MGLTKATNRMTANAHINLRDFGAVGDGVTDDTVALQAAYAAAKAEKLAFYMPKGDYLFSSPLVWDGYVDVYGDGSADGDQDTRLRKNGDFVGITIEASGMRINDFTVTSVDAPSSALPTAGDTSDGIYFKLSQLSTIERITVNYQGGDGFDLRQGGHCNWNAIMSRYNGGSGIVIDAANSYAVPNSYFNANTFSNIDVLGNVDHGLWLKDGTNEYNVMTNLVTQNNGKHGLFCESAKNHISVYAEVNDNVTFFPGGTGGSLGDGTGGYYDITLSTNAYRNFIHVLHATTNNSIYNADPRTAFINYSVSGGTIEAFTFTGPRQSLNDLGNPVYLQGVTAGAGAVGKAGGSVSIGTGGAAGTAGASPGGRLNLSTGSGINGGEKGFVMVNKDDDANFIIGSETRSTTTAILELKSTTQGFVLPRMTTLQRDAIASPIEGMMIFNKDTNVVNFHSGAAWLAI
jgi:hypothetical protein